MGASRYACNDCISTKPRIACASDRQPSLRDFLRSLPPHPTFETLGYCRVSLRDRHSRITLKSPIPAPLLLDFLHLEKPVKLPNSSWVPHFAQSFGFNLTDTLAGNAELPAHLFERA